MAKKILTIENCNAISYLIDTVLGREFEVTTVKNCGHAYTHLQKDADKEVIIMDIPDSTSDNLELLQHIHTSAVFKNVRTVVISNSDDENLKNKTVELGASLFLTKPFDPVYLSDQVRDLIPANKKAGKKRYFNLNIF